MLPGFADPAKEGAVARAVRKIKPGAPSVKPRGAAEHAISRAAREYLTTHEELERAYEHLVAAIRRHKDMPRRRLAALTGLSKTRIQQIIEEE